MNTNFYSFVKNNFILIIFVTVAILILSVFPKWIVDDAFILFRYAENLAKYGELNWNVGNNPVEGYTGVTLPFLLTLGFYINLEPIMFSHILGIGSFLTLIILFFSILKTLKINKTISLISLIIFVFSPALYTHVFSGLETIIFITLLLAVILLMLQIFKSQNCSIKFYVSLFVLSLTRPEGILLAILAYLIILYYFYLNNKHSLLEYIKKSVIFFVIPFAIYFGYKTIYYGAIFPNTYYIKSANSQFNLNSYFSFINFFKYYLLIPTLINLIFLILTIVIGRNFTNLIKLIKKDAYIFVLIITFSVILIYKYLHTSLLMNYSYRFFIPLFPLFLILLSYTADFFIKEIKQIANFKIFTFLISFAIIILISLQINIIYFQFKKEVTFAAKHILLINNVHIKVGKFLRKEFPNSKIIVHADAGAIPFYSKLETIDFGGLNDEYLAQKTNLTNQNIIDYFFNVNADVLVITSFDYKEIKRVEGSLNWETLKEIIKDKRFENYKLIKKFGTEMWNYYEFVFIKR